MVRGHSGGGSLTLAGLIDKAGDGLLPDLKRYYDIDLIETIEGQGTSPALVLSYVRALPEESLSRALLRDQPDTEGWSHERYLLAGIFDVIRENTMATGQWTKKVPDLKFWPRPGETSESAETKPVSLDDLWKRFSVAAAVSSK